MSRREKRFLAQVGALYRAGTEVYYTRTLNPLLGARGYWTAHGWKAPTDPALSVGVQVIYALCLATPVFTQDVCTELRGWPAAVRRSNFKRFHLLSPPRQQDYLWFEYLAPQFDLSLTEYRRQMAAAFRVDPVDVVAERGALGAAIWRAYRDDQRGRWFSLWRVPTAVGEALDQMFRRETYERYGWLPPNLNPEPPVLAEEDI